MHEVVSIGANVIHNSANASWCPEVVKPIEVSPHFLQITARKRSVNPKIFSYAA